MSKMSKNKVLVIGSGGREHAIIHQIKKSPLLGEIFYLGQNAKIQEIAQLATGIDASNHEQIIEFCQATKIDLVIIGPEQSLIDG
ncbi:MAG: phosphoribosylamine--glycine ligase, partial [Rickettsiales bacterium]